MSAGKASRLLYVIAHPDDEDALTLTYLCRSLGVHCTLFSLTRGEGGANLIGKERDEALGFLRTRELARACAGYGVSQLLFSSAFDYGFSRRVEEAHERWDAELLAQELAMAMDLSRAQIVLSRFSGATEDGHAHHRFCAELVSRAAPLATQAPRILYGGGNGPRTLFAIDVVDQALASYREHRSQDPERLLAGGGAALCHYRSRSGDMSYQGEELAALFQADSEAGATMFASPATPLALPGVRVRSTDAMYRWRSPACRLQPFASAAQVEASPQSPIFATPAAPIWVAPGQRAQVPVCVDEKSSDSLRVRVGDSLIPLAGTGSARSFDLAPRASGRFPLALVAGDQETTLFREELSDHSWFLREAYLSVVCADIQVAAVPVGYVPGDGDGVLASLASLGVEADALTHATDLSRYRTVIIGERAYARNKPFAVEHDALMAFCQAGGHLVVLSQVPPFDPELHAPWPGRCPEDAPEACEAEGGIRILLEHPLLCGPNRLSLEDFAHWSSGRGRKFWTRWDKRYQPLVALRDAREPEQEGAWLSTRVGAGHYTYCALNLGSQWAGAADPRAATGALRILANLVSLGAAPGAV